MKRHRRVDISFIATPQARTSTLPLMVHVLPPIMMLSAIASGSPALRRAADSSRSPHRQRKGVLAMSFVRNLPNARKFTYAFGIICLLCAGLAGYSFFTLRGIAAKAADIGDNGVPSVINVAEMRNDANSVRRAELALILCPTTECTTHYQQVRQKAIDEIHSTGKLYEPLISYPGERELYQKFTSTFAQYLEVSDRSMADLTAGNKVDATQLLLAPDEVNSNAVALKAADDDLQLIARESSKEAATMAADSTRTTWVSLLTTLIIIVLCAIIGSQLNRFVTPRTGLAITWK